MIILECLQTMIVLLLSYPGQVVHHCSSSLRKFIRIYLLRRLLQSQRACTCVAGLLPAIYQDTLIVISLKSERHSPIEDKSPLIQDENNSVQLSDYPQLVSVWSPPELLVRSARVINGGALRFCGRPHQ
jgi:hypothetical protein